MAAPPRMTTTTQLVLRALLEEPGRERYGLEVCRLVELPTGTVHPILARLEGAGWLVSRWEEVDASEQGRPRRRYYRLTEDGVQSALTALARVHTPRRLVDRIRVGGLGEAWQ